ncbi:MAG: hypothetical protein J1F68_03790 [Clostridiales bacterium]|nr:hypothetical protein [Clostridiales bacterium]
MKKLLGICICILLICAAIVPTVVFAETYTTDDIIHFMSPTALTVEGDSLYVADNIEDGKGVIHIFDLSANTPRYVNTMELNTNISNISISEGVLYAMAGSRVFEITVATNKITELELEKSLGSIVDVAVYKNSLILFAETGLYINGAGYADQATKNAIACVASGEYVYYLYGQNSNSAQRRKQSSGGLTAEANDRFNDNLQWSSGFAAIGMFAWDNNEVAIFGEHTIYYSVNAGSQYNLDQLVTFDDFVIRDADMANNRLYVLTRNNQVKIYGIGENNNLTDLDITIGSDTLNQDVPTEYTSFTLVKSQGYPTNIVFKTTGDNSIVDIITDATEYIVIGYDGDENSNFYYVLLGDKFGWVKKSENASSVEKDDKLQVLNTNVSDDNFTTRAKFVSLHAVYVSPLPRQFFYDNENYRKTFTQSSSNRIDVVVLQKFSEGDKVWYYVSFEVNGEPHSGFVPQDALGQFNISGSLEGVRVVGQRKVNSTLFSTVKVYDETMTDSAYDSDGNQIKPLTSGTRVTLIREQDGVAFIQIQYNNGNVAYGYVYADRLIGEHQITTNAAVGITLLSIAAALGVALTVVLLRRRRRNKGTTASKEN